MARLKARKGWLLFVLAVVGVAVYVTRPPLGLGHEAGEEGRDGKAVRVPEHAVELLLTLGIKDSAQDPWVGKVSVSPGRVVNVEIQRAARNSTVTGHKFDVRAARAKGKKNVKPIKPSDLDPAILRVTLDAPPSATFKVELEKGEIVVALAELQPDKAKTVLNGKASVEKVETATALTGKETEDDFPVMAQGRDGTVWLAYVEYEPGPPLVMERITGGAMETLADKRHGDRVRLRHYNGRTWSAPIDVTESGLDIWRPTIAVDGRGAVTVVWTQKDEHAWNLHSRTYTPAGDGKGTWSKIHQLEDRPGADFQAVATTDSKGKVWLAWQAWRVSNYEILLASQNDDGTWSEPTAISTSKANDWNPSIAADTRGNVYVAWDTYDRGNYDVQMHVAGANSRTMAVADSARFEARACLACDADGHVWVAYEEGDEQWGKDYANTAEFRKIGLESNPGYALYINRTVKVKCLVNGEWKQPVGNLDEALKDDVSRGRSVPRLCVDKQGGMWLAVRHALLRSGAGEAWVSYMLRHDGRDWGEPVRLAGSSNLMDNRPALAATDAGVLAVYSGDDRTKTQDRGQDDLFMTVLKPEGAAAARQFVACEPTPEPKLKNVHDDEAAVVARMREHRVNYNGRELHLLRGEFHRHTEFSAHRDGDGLLEDSIRYAHDAGDLDFMGNGDHDNGLGHEYMWWLIQKTFDIYHQPTHFVGCMTYERSVSYPNGHRNVMMPRRGIRPLPRGDLKDSTPEMGTADTKVLYNYLRHFGGICASHTSGTSMGTDWRDNDPEVEPIVEIYQGHRHNYEHFGAPRSATAETQIGGYKPAGFLWHALEKGYRFGFEASSDHISTHMSFGVALAEERSRQSIIDAFKARHCYAATDNIILIVRSGQHLMGDAFTTKDPPTLAIEAVGTGPIARLHVVRDNKYVYSIEPNEREVKRTFTDMDSQPGKTSYYYVRIEQADGELAWASPMWITREK